MKTFKFQTIVMVCIAAALLMSTSCKKKYDVPPTRPLEIDSVYTISDILALNGNAFNFPEGITAGVYGIITADEVSGNLYKSVYMQDRATGAAINLYMSASSGVRIGDSICVILNGTVSSTYNGLPQLGTSGSPLNPNDNIVILGNRQYIQPRVVTISEINAGQTKAQVIKLENVEFVSPGLPFAEDGGYGERMVKDELGNQVMIRTSNYANFATVLTPSGKGSLIAINSVYGSTQQLILRSIKEVLFDGTGGGGTTIDPGEVQSLPYTQSFATSFGTYITKDVFGPQSWMIDFSTAKMTGYENSVNNANEDWLISSPVDLSGVSEAKLSMTYITRYFSDLNNDITIQVSTNYEFGNDPASATWTAVPATWVSGSDWSTFATTDVSLTDFVGQTVTVAVKYISTETKAGTIEIQSISITEGDGGLIPPDLQGDGTRYNPYTANDVIALAANSASEYVWVKGYIVGQYAGFDPEFAAPWTSSDTTGLTQTNTNIIISSTQNASNISICVPVQLPTGALRIGLNLPGNNGLYGEEVLLYGTLQTYFSAPGIKTPTYAEINGNSFGIDPGDGTETVLFEQSLLTQESFNTFAIDDVNGNQTWTFSTSGYGATISGYVNADQTSYANEDWFISPEIDMSASSNPIFSFEHARGPAASINVGVAEGFYTVWVSNNYTGGEVSEASWEQLDGIIHPTAGWAWVSSGQISIPEAYRTATCRIAFKYLSQDGSSATWEIKNVKVIDD